MVDETDPREEMPQEREPLSETARGETAAAGTPVSADDSQPAPAQGEEREEAAWNVDWRIVAVVVIAAAFLILAYISRGKKKPASPGEVTAPVGATTSGPGETTAPRLPLTPKQAYAMAIRRQELQSTETVYLLKDKRCMVAHPPVPVPDKNDRRRIVGLLPGRLFDVSKLKRGFSPGMFHRRPGFGGRGVLFTNAIPPLGAGSRLALVVKSADEITLDVMPDTERVVGLNVDGEARAYPVRYLNYHEVVNDTLGGKPLAVSWSAFGDAAAAMLRTPLKEGGAAMIFGSTGLMFQSTIVLFDRETESLWWSVRRECIGGELLGKRLKAVRVTLTNWRAWKALHPATTVLAGTEPALGFDYSKDPAVPVGYRGNDVVLFPVYGIDIETTPMALKSRVFGVLAADGRTAKAYHLGLLRELDAGKMPFEDDLGGAKIRVAYNRESDTLAVEDAAGKPLFTEAMMWTAWVGAHQKTEVWQESKLRAKRERDMAARMQAQEAPAGGAAPLGRDDKPKP